MFKGVFKGGGFRGFKPDRNFQIFFLEKWRKRDRKKKKKKGCWGGGGWLPLNIFLGLIFFRVGLRYFHGGLRNFRESEKFS